MEPTHCGLYKHIQVRKRILSQKYNNGNSISMASVIDDWLSS